MKNRPTLLAALALFACAASALADEYTVETFTGGYSAPPQNAVQVIPRSRDDQTTAVNLPFSFPYFGRVYSRISVCSNGWLAFGTTTATESANPVLPSTAAPNGVVAPLWDDLDTGDGTVSRYTLGVAGARTFVVSWNGVDTFSSAQTSDLSFQVRLYEATGVIEFVYAGTGAWTGLSYTAGIENDAGTIAFVEPGTSGNANTGQPGANQRFVPNAVDVSGVLLRDRPVADATGLGNTNETDLPVDGAEVALINPLTGETLATGLSTSSGAFTVTALGVDDPFTLDVNVRAAGTASRVVDAAAGVYDHRIASAVLATGSPDLGTIRLDADVDLVNAAFRRALNIQQAARRGFLFATDAAQYAADQWMPQATPETFSRLDFQFTPDVLFPEGTRYVPSAGTVAARVEVSDGGQNRDPWDDDVIVREYAHHVYAAISSHPGVGVRSWDQPSGQEGALADGFAHWFAAVLRGSPSLVDTLSSTEASIRDLETPDPDPIRLDSVTGAVAACLWDLVDPANEDHDRHAGVAGGVPSDALDVFATFDRALDAPPTGTFFNVRDFFLAWRADGPVADREAAARNFIHHGALFDDSYEPNDEAGEEGAFPGESQKLLGLQLTPFNQDRFRFTLKSQQDDVLSATFQQESSDETAADVEVEILDAGGTSLATATNVGQAARDVVRVSTPMAVAPGDYFVHVRWISGDATAAYTLTFANPLALVTTTLPEWTAGVPFKEDFAVRGGVPPYAFTTVESVPGITTELGGSRLTGTPSTAGPYSVQVAVADDDAPTASVSEDVALTINPALALPGHFGVAEQRPLDTAIGSGGTLPTWVVGTAPPAPFALTGGASLRLTGPAAGPQSFTLAGHATDSVGASVGLSTATVVVALELDGKRTTPVPVGDRFGVFFDALAGSTAELDLRFSGNGPSPEFVALIDAAGTPIPDANGRRNRRRVRVGPVTLTETGRYFVILSNAPGEGNTPFVGELKATSDVSPLRKVRGQEGIGAENATFDVTFEGVAGASVDVVLRRGKAPLEVRPVLMAVLGPDGQPIAPLPAPRISKGGGKYVVRRIPLTQSGTHTIRVAASDRGPVGAVSWKAKLRVPKGVRFELD